MTDESRPARSGRRPSLLVALLGPLLISLVAGSIGLGLYVHRAVERDLVTAVDDELVRALNATRERLSRPGPIDPNAPPAAADTSGADDGSTGESNDESSADAPIQLVLDDDGAVIEATAGSSSLDADDLAAVAAADGIVTVGDNVSYRTMSVDVTEGRTLVVGLSLEGVEDSLASLRRNLVLGGIVLVAIQSLVALAVTRIVARPVTRLSTTAHRIAGGDLEAEPGHPSGPLEIATLTEDLQVMLDRLRITIDEREAAARSAQRARQDMERFMADASHELRTPLTALRGYTDLYQAGMLDETGVATAMGRIGSESGRLTRLVRDLLELVRPDGGHDEPVDLGAVASAVVHDLRAAHPDFPLTLRLDDHNGAESIRVLGDPALVHQAVLNLAANARQHTPDGTPAEVAVTGGGEWVEVAVIDHGPGVDPEMADTVFEPFVRADRSRSRHRHDGAGLGLSLVRRIADRHDGTIGFEDTPGGGATFLLRLPATDAGSPEGHLDAG